MIFDYLCGSSDGCQEVFLGHHQAWRCSHRWRSSLFGGAWETIHQRWRKTDSKKRIRSHESARMRKRHYNATKIHCLDLEAKRVGQTKDIHTCQLCRKAYAVRPKSQRRVKAILCTDVTARCMDFWWHILVTNIGWTTFRGNLLWLLQRTFVSKQASTSLLSIHSDEADKERLGFSNLTAVRLPTIYR